MLGPLEEEGIEGVDLGGQRQQSVLVLLPLEGGGWGSRDRFVAGVWGDPPTSAVSTLQGCVSHVRSALASSPLCRVSRRAEYAINSKSTSTTRPARGSRPCCQTIPITRPLRSIAFGR